MAPSIPANLTHQALRGPSGQAAPRPDATPAPAYEPAFGRIEEQGAVVDTSTPEQLALTVKQELAKWKGVVLKAQLTPD